MFGFGWVFLEFFLNNLEELFYVRPLLVRSEYFFNKLAKKSLLFFVNYVDVGELALKGILSINGFIKNAAQRKNIRLGIYQKIRVIVKNLWRIVLKIFLYIGKEKFVHILHLRMVALGTDVLWVEDYEVFL